MDRSRISLDKECSWTGPIPELRDHVLTSCQYQDGEACPFVDAGIEHTKKMERAELHQHSTGDEGPSRHMKTVADSLKEVSIFGCEASSGDRGVYPADESAYFSEITKSLSGYANEIELVKSKIDGLWDRLKRLDQAQQQKLDIITRIQTRLLDQAERNNSVITELQATLNILDQEQRQRSDVELEATLNLLEEKQLHYSDVITELQAVLNVLKQLLRTRSAEADQK